MSSDGQPFVLPERPDVAKAFFQAVGVVEAAFEGVAEIPWDKAPCSCGRCLHLQISSSILCTIGYSNEAIVTNVVYGSWYGSAVVWRIDSRELTMDATLRDIRRCLTDPNRQGCAV